MSSSPSVRRLLPAALAVSVLLAFSLGGCAPSATAGRSTPTPSASPRAVRVTDPPVPGGRLLFRRFLDAAQTQGALFVCDSDGSHERRIVPPAADVAYEDLNWSRDGSRFVFTRVTSSGGNEAHRIFSAKSDGTSVHALTAGKPAHGASVPGFDGSPVFSPDGSRIAYVHSSGLVEHDELEHSDVYVMRADGSDAKPITRFAPYSGDSGGIAWSPDGKHLVAVRSDAVAGTTALFVMEPDGSHTRRLTKPSLGAGGQTDWTARGDLIAFRVADEDSGIGNFFVIRSDGGGLRQVTHLTETKVSHKVAFSPDGTWITFAVADSRGSNDLAVAAVSDGRVRIVKHTALEESGPSWTTP
jgi:TolB protein